MAGAAGKQLKEGILKTSPVTQSGPNLFFWPQEWNNRCQDPLLWPAYRLGYLNFTSLPPLRVSLKAWWHWLCVGEVDFLHSWCWHRSTWNAKHKHFLKSAKCPHYSKAWKQVRNCSDYQPNIQASCTKVGIITCEKVQRKVTTLLTAGTKAATV